MKADQVIDLHYAPFDVSTCIECPKRSGEDCHDIECFAWKCKLEQSYEQIDGMIAELRCAG